jgi:hypothetical protein
MLSKIRAAIIWMRMRRKYREGDYEAASRLADQHKRTGVKSHIFDAFDATLDVLNKKIGLAQEKFRNVADATRNRPDPESQYIHEYAMYCVTLSEQKSDAAETHRKAAKRIARSFGRSPFISRALPLLGSPAPDKWF